MQRILCFLCVAAATTIANESSWGREPETAATLYSRGVHAYFAGRPSEAESLLSQALGMDDRDPRIFYFRALSLLKLGREAEARGDMMVGAALEAERWNRYAVGNALQRVQGSHRLLLESYRRKSRSEATTVRQQVARRHATQMSARDTGALRERIVIPLEELLRPGEPRPLSADELARRAAVARQAETAPTPPEAAQPPAVGAEPPDNPFGDDAAQPPVESPEPARAEPATPPQTDPAAENADDNPFGEF